MNEIVLTLFTNYVLPVLGSAILALGSYGVTLLNKKLKNEQIKQAFDMLSKVARNVVLSLNQTMVPMIREKSADGKLSKQDMDAIKSRAIMLIKSQMQDEALELLDKNTIDVSGLIDSVIESNVLESKACLDDLFNNNTPQ